LDAISKVGGRCPPLNMKEVNSSMCVTRTMERDKFQGQVYFMAHLVTLI
jgi:hypothetical protein